MTLDDIYALILGSQPDEWNRVDRGSPTFLYGLVYDGEHQGLHDARAVYKLNVAVGIAWGLKANENYRADWIEKFADSENAWSEYIDILYNGNPVDRKVRVVVDGGRAALPPPAPIIEGELGDARQVGWKVTEEDHNFNLTFERLFGEGEETYREYFALAEIQIQP
jgi:hypothetical protein